MYWIDKVSLSAYISEFSINNNRLSLSFFIINNVEQVLTKETVEAALYNGMTLKYNYMLMVLVKNDVKNTSTSLTIVLTCSFSGLFVIVIAIIFVVRWRKRR